MSRFHTYIVLLMASVMLAGCEHHHLYYATRETVKVTLNVDWSEAGLSPNGLTAYAYRSSGELYKQFPSFSSTHKVDLQLPEGNFDVVLFNNTPSEYLYVSFDRREQLASLVANAAPKTAVRTLSKADQQKDVIANPEVVASAKVEDITITKQAIDYFYDRPDSHLQTSYVEYDVVPLRRVVNVRIFVHTSGLQYAAGPPLTLFKHFSGGYRLGLEQADERQVIQEVTLKNVKLDNANDKTVGTIFQEFTSFGEVADPQARYLVDIDFVLIDGTSFNPIVDVTDQIERYMDGVIPRIDIRLAFTLPEAEAPEGEDSEGSFDASAEDWNNVNVNVSM